MAIIGDNLRVTTGELHVYCDIDNGNDANDGLSISKAKATLTASLASIPDYIKHNTTLHITGTYTDYGTVRVTKYIGSKDDGTSANFVIDGGSNYTKVAGPFTADISTTASIGNSGQSWKADLYAGFIAEILDGAQAGSNHTIQWNNSTTVFPVKLYSSSPGSATFKISRPETQFKDSGTWNLNVQGPGNFYFQRFHFTGSGNLINIGSSENVNLVGIVSQMGDADNIQTSYAKNVTFGGSHIDPNTYVLDTTQFITVSQTKELGTETWLIQDCNGWSLYGGVCRASTTFYNTKISQMSNGFRMKQFSMRVETTNNLNSITGDTSNYQMSKFNGEDQSSTLITIGNGARISLLPPVDLSNGTNAFHFIQGRSSLFLGGDITGTNNTQYGLRISHNADVVILNGTPPSLTGSTGGVIIDGNNVKTFAGIDNTPYVDTTRGAIVRNHQ